MVDKLHRRRLRSHASLSSPQAIGALAGRTVLAGCFVVGCATGVDITEAVTVAPGSGGIEALEGFYGEASASEEGDGPGAEAEGLDETSATDGDGEAEPDETTPSDDAASEGAIDELPLVEPSDEVTDVDEVSEDPIDAAPDEPSLDEEPSGAEGADETPIDEAPNADPLPVPDSSEDDPDPVDPGASAEPEPEPEPLDPISDVDSPPPLEPIDAVDLDDVAPVPALGHCLGGWEGSSCDTCSGETQSDRSTCRLYIECYVESSCEPGTCGGVDGACGVNQLGNGLAPKSIADSVYDCMCG